MSNDRYTPKDAVLDTVELVVVTPVFWLLSKTLGRLLDAT
jgi:hypothetical protein